MDQRQKKEYESFDTKLKSVIESFERAREWADLSACLNRVKQHINAHPRLEIQRPKELSKRLAQCLDPEINPVHSLTLEVYQFVFERELEMQKIYKDNKEKKSKQKGAQTPGSGSDQKDRFCSGRKSSVGLYFSGLFNFYQHASFEVKLQFLNLVKNFMLKLERELIQSLPGFMLCMLPAFDEQNQEILKLVEEILLQTEKIVGTSEFFGQIWLAMLRTKRSRYPAIRYLDKRIPATLEKAKAQLEKNVESISISGYTIQISEREVQLDKDEDRREMELERKKRMDLQDYFYFYYPNKTKLVINALIQGLSDKQNDPKQVQVINRATLDFLISHMAIKSKINSLDEMVNLTEHVTLAFTRKDFATVNKISIWLFGHLEQYEDDDEAIVDDNDPLIKALVGSQKKLFLQSVEELRTKQTFGVYNQDDKMDLGNNVVCILMRILSDPSCDLAVDPILKNLSADLLMFIKFHQKNRDEASLRSFNKNLNSLLDVISADEQGYTYYGAVLESLANKLKSSYMQDQKNHDNVDDVLETIDLISFAIFDILKHYQDYQGTYGKQKLVNQNDDQDLINILSLLLKCIEKYQNNQELKQMSLVLIDKILKLLQQFTKSQQQHHDFYIKIKDSVDLFNKLYVEMSMEGIKYGKTDKKLGEDYSQFLHNFRQYNDIMVRIIRYQNVDNQVGEKPKWLQCLIDYSKGRFQQQDTHFQTSILAVDTFIKLLMNEDDLIFCPYNKDHSQLQKLIYVQSQEQYNYGYNRPLGPIPAACHNCDNRKFQEGEIYFKCQKCEQQHHSHFKNFIWCKSCTLGGKCEDFKQKKSSIVEIKNMIADNQEIKEIIKNLWSNLDGEHDAERIVDHLISFDKDQPKIFSDVVIDDLNQRNAKAIKKFAVFWQITGEKHPQDYQPFEKEMHYNDDIVDEKGAQKQRKYLALHTMIDFLEDTDPTLRLSCRSWISQDKRFQRILDPIIEEFMMDGQFNQFITQNFGKLRNIILNTQEEAINFLLHRQAQGHVRDKFQAFQSKKAKMFDNEDDKWENRSPSFAKMSMQMDRGDAQMDHQQPPYKSECQYLNILVEITLYFIRMGSQNHKNDTQILSVSASACEFMELILKQVSGEKYSSFSNKISQKIIEPLIQSFWDVIQHDSSDMQPMQVNIINLLELIFNHCNFQGIKTDSYSDPDQKAKSLERQAKILENTGNQQPMLIKAIIKGLQSPVSFIRQKFIKFVTMFVPYLKSFAKTHDSFKKDFQTIIENLIDTFCDLLKRVDNTQYSQARNITYMSTLMRAGQQSDKPMDKSIDELKFDDLGDLNVSSRQSSVIKDKKTVQQFRLNIEKSRKDTKIRKDKDVQKQQDLIINNESDIVLIIDGLQRVINTCLDIKQEGLSENDAQQGDEQGEIDQNRINQQRKNEKKQWGLFQGNGEGLFADPFQPLRDAIKDKFDSILVSCIYCWNSVAILSQTDYHFTRTGMFAFQTDDNKKVLNMLKNQRSQGQASVHMNMEESLQKWYNNIQKKVVELLRPLAKRMPDVLIDGALKVWLKRSLLGDVNINKSYEKLIQILICVGKAQQIQPGRRMEYILPMHQVISSSIKFITNQDQNEKALVNMKRKKQKPELTECETSSETLLCHFIYAYITYNLCFEDPLFELMTNDKKYQQDQVFKAIQQWFKTFRMSRNPYTIMWNFEILQLVSLKLSRDCIVDNKAKQEHHLQLNTMLRNLTDIISDSFNIKFSKKQFYKFVFPPTVYELLWRYEYNVFKQAKELEQSKNSDYSQIFDSSIIVLDESKMQKNPDKYKRKQEKLIGAIMKNGSVFFDKNQLKEMIAQKFEFNHQNQSKQAYAMSIFRNMPILMDGKNQQIEGYESQNKFMQKIMVAMRSQEEYCKIKMPNLDHEMLIQSRFFSIITLRQNLTHLVSNLIGGKDQFEKTNQSYQIVFAMIFKMLSNFEQINMSDFSKMQTSDKRVQNTQTAQPDTKTYQEQEMMNQYIIQFFAQLVEQTTEADDNLIRPYRKHVIEIFNNDQFFVTSKLNLKQWQKIMTHFIDLKAEDIFEEQMSKWNMQGGLFVGNERVILQKCQAMERIAFLVFSCKQTIFTSTDILEELKKKIAEIFKLKQKTHIKQRIFLLFLTRVLLTKLDMNLLTSTLRYLWPHLLQELISVFEIKKGTFNEGSDQEVTDLTIEAIKLVELLSSLNIEDFQMNQWIFLIDGYGMRDRSQHIGQEHKNRMKHALKSENERLAQGAKIGQQSNMMQTPRSQSKVYQRVTESSEVFMTYIVRFIYNRRFNFYNVEDPQDGKMDKLEYQEQDNQNFKNSPILQFEELDQNPKDYKTDEDEQGIRNSGQEQINSSQMYISSSQMPDQASTHTTGTQPQSRQQNAMEFSSNMTRKQSSQRMKEGMILNMNYSDRHMGDQQYAPVQDYQYYNGSSNEDRLQEEAIKLQTKINDSNLVGNEFNRQDMEAKIEDDFLNNNDILKPMERN